MAIPPPCHTMGSQCRSLKVTLRVGSLEDGPESLDHEATWLLGHTQRIQFAELWDDGEDLFVEARLHIPCRFFRQDAGEARCALYGYRGPPIRPARRLPQPRILTGDKFAMVRGRKLGPVQARFPSRSLPVLNGDNPCASARCETSDHTRRAACCRDMELEIMCDLDQVRLESLVRHRQSPYLCKVERAGDYSLSVEVISACGYLGEDGIACTLHGRLRPDGRPAKPDLCSEWPDRKRDLHPGCVFASRGGQGRMIP